MVEVCRVSSGGTVPVVPATLPPNETRDGSLYYVKVSLQSSGRNSSVPGRSRHRPHRNIFLWTRVGIVVIFVLRV